MQDLGTKMLSVLFDYGHIFVTVHAPRIKDGEPRADGTSIVWCLTYAPMIEQNDYQKSIEAVVRTSLTLGGETPKINQTVTDSVFLLRQFAFIVIKHKMIAALGCSRGVIG